MTDEMKRDEEIQRVAMAAARAAAELVNTAAIAAHQVTATAASAAHVLAESTRVDLHYIKDDLKDIKLRLDSKFVTVEAFDPVRKLVYGLVGIILTAVVIALVTLVVRQ